MADDPVVVEGGRIDVSDVMARIRERIRAKREIGRYSDEEVEELTALKLQAFADEAEIDPDLLARLMAQDHNWNISTDYRIETHRKGLSARLVVWAKTLVRPLVRLYTDQPLSRQAQINLYLLHLCHHLAQDVVRLQLENTSLKNRCDAARGARRVRRRRARPLNLAFVLPRYGPEGEGEGAARARDLGSRLVAQGHSLEIWSTAALDPVTWENVLDTGATEADGITVRRFSVTRAEEGEAPLVSGLLEHVRRHRRELDVAIFFSSPAWAEAHGLRLAPESSVLVARGGRHRMLPDGCGATVVFDTPEEQAARAAVAEGPRPRSEVIGSGVDLGVEPARTEAPEALKGLGRYVVLVAPLEARDGCAVTVDSFLRAEREGRVPVTLVLIGRGRISLGENVHVRQLGDLSGTAQDQATRGSLAVLVPSRLEVVAPSALRAWRLGRPVIAHGRAT